jgi:hypothetical protein
LLWIIPISFFLLTLHLTKTSLSLVVNNQLIPAMKNCFFYSKKIILFILFTSSFCFKANSQELFLSVKGGGSLLFVRDGYGTQNWGTNWGIGATYMIKDSVVGLDIQGLFHIMSGPDYNNDALIYPLMLKLNLDYKILIQLELGGYYERFTRTGDQGYATYKSGDIGAIVGLNYMYPVSSKWLFGAEFEVLHGYSKPIIASLPNANTGGIGPPASYNLLFTLMNLQLVYHIGY